jgi:hypothetical protein
VGFCISQLAVHPDWEGGMGSRFVFRIAYSFATLIGSPLESCAKRIREKRYDDSNIIMKDPGLRKIERGPFNCALAKNQYAYRTATLEASRNIPGLLMQILMKAKGS